MKQQILSFFNTVSTENDFHTNHEPGFHLLRTCCEDNSLKYRTLMENPWYSLFVGGRGNGKQCLPTPGTWRSALARHMFKQFLVPSGRTIWNVFTSGVSRRISVMIGPAAAKRFSFASTTTIAHLLGTMRLMTFLLDIQRSRAFLHAASASDLRIHSIVVVREVNQLVHETLTGNAVSVWYGCFCCHHRKVRVHTGIPATVTLYTVSCIESPDHSTGSRTGERTGPAAQAGIGKLFPFPRIIETLFLSCLRPIPRGRDCYLASCRSGTDGFSASTSFERSPFARYSFTSAVSFSPFSVFASHA